MELIQNYENALQAIYDHVGFEEDWFVAPIDNKTDMFWSTDGETVKYADSKEELEKEEWWKFYVDDVYKQRFYDKWIYEGEEFTMIFCEPRVDGIIWLRIFCNKKRMN